MAEFILTVPGHVVVPTQGGPDRFDNVGGLGWTDQQGHRRPTDVRFNGKPDQRPIDFHLPFTTPLFFGTGPLGSGTRMNVVRVFVTFFTDPVVRVDRIRVMDRLTTLFDSLPLFGALGMTSPTLFRNSTIFGRNLHDVLPSGAPRAIDKSLGVTVTVNFGSGGIVGFTGAGFLLTN
jgi:hypothetical protein